MSDQVKKYEVTFFLNGTIKTVVWNEQRCIAHFGTDEWCEYRDGYIPNVVVVEIED